MSEVLRQADPLWHDDVVGDGDVDQHHTLGWIGCLCTAAAIAGNHFGGKFTPRDVNELAKKNKCFGANKAGYHILLNLELIAPHLGLRMLDRERVRWKLEDPNRVRQASLMAVNVLQAGGAVILHVDHNNDKEHGDPLGDHFIIGRSRPAVAADVFSDITCSDPAPGKVIPIHEETMTGDSLWGADKKHYKVVSVVPVWKA